MDDGGGNGGRGHGLLDDAVELAERGIDRIIDRFSGQRRDRARKQDRTDRERGHASTGQGMGFRSCI